MRFNDGTISNLAPLAITKDNRLEGYAGLEISVTSKGTKTFYYRYTTSKGKRVRFRVGPYINAHSIEDTKKRLFLLGRLLPVETLQQRRNRRG